MKKIALAISLIGILIIFTIINLIEINLTPTNQISLKNIGQQIKTSGITSNLKTYENNFTTFTLNNEIEIICNCPNIKNNQKLEILGTVSKYENKLQIEANKISTIKD